MFKCITIILVTKLISHSRTECHSIKSANLKAYFEYKLHLVFGFPTSVLLRLISGCGLGSDMVVCVYDGFQLRGGRFHRAGDRVGGVHRVGGVGRCIDFHLDHTNLQRECIRLHSVHNH